MVTGVLERECEDLIRPFAKWITSGFPYVIVKAGQSLDGRITRPPGEGQWITNEEAQRHGRALRRRVDAILVGAQTVRQDNPRLTLREAAGTSGKEQPLRVILTRTGRLPEEAHVFTDEHKNRTLVLHDLPLSKVLQELGRRGIVSVLIEGGGNVLAQAFKSQLVDEVYWYIAPLLCGTGVPTLNDPSWEASVGMDEVNIVPMGNNVCVMGRPRWPNK